MGLDVMLVTYMLHDLERNLCLYDSGEDLVIVRRVWFDVDIFSGRISFVI